MGECQYKHVAVIGCGAVAEEVLKTVHLLADKYGYTEEYVEYEVHPFNAAKKYAQEEDIPLYVIEDKNHLTEHFDKMLGKRTLVICANNDHLFLNDIISGRNLTIINFHNAILSELPGWNAPSWAIYEGKTYTGITWHYVTKGVDDKDIIIQKKCDIDEDIRAYELAVKLMQMASETFNECYESILTESVHVNKQKVSDKRKLYESYEIPGEGVFKLTDPPVDIYRLLRAMDYGKNDIFPLPKTVLEERTIQIRKYKKIKTVETEERKDRIYLPLDENYCLMLGYDTVDVSGKITGSVDDLEYLYRLIAELKVVKRRLISNMLLDENELNALIQQDKLQYEYLNGKYLNLWYQEWDYFRLFFYIADIDGYKPIDFSETVICDLFFGNYNKNNEVIICKLCEEHFVKYAQYHKWIRSDQTQVKPDSLSELMITDGCAEGFYDLLRKCFDIYSDCVPEPNLFEHYLRDKECYSAFEAKSGRLVGGIVISARGDVQAEEYVFSDFDMRGKGIAAELHSNWYAQTDDSNIKYTAWIRDDNEASKRLHKKYNYETQSSYKITMRR